MGLYFYGTLFLKAFAKPSAANSLSKSLAFGLHGRVDLRLFLFELAEVGRFLLPPRKRLHLLWREVFRVRRGQILIPLILVFW